MPSDTQLDGVRSILLATLGALDAPTSFSEWLRIPLIQPGKVLGNSDRALWVQLVLASCAATAGNPAIGARVAAGVELFMAALDLLDEIEDDDFSPTVKAIGTPQALNVATALLLLGQRTLLELPLREGLPGPADFARVLAAGGLTATGGQQQDLASAGAAVTSTTQALAIAQQKSGALAGTACRLGAMVGTADTTLLDLYARWGTHYGTAAQLGNDLHDALDSTQKSDIERQKGTLPLIFNQHARGDAAPPTDVAESGALHFTWVVVEIERQACRDLNVELVARGQHISLLQQFVP